MPLPAPESYTLRKQKGHLGQAASFSNNLQIYDGTPAPVGGLDAAAVAAAASFRIL